MKPTIEELADSVTKSATRAAKENLAANTSRILSPEEELILQIGILAGVKAMASELGSRGAIKEHWG